MISKIVVSLRQYANLASWTHLASMEACGDHTALKITSTFQGICAFTWHLTREVWTAGSGKQLRQKNRHYVDEYIYIYITIIDFDQLTF